MELEDFFCSIEQSRKLVSLGVSDKTVFCYSYRKGDSETTAQIVPANLYHKDFVHVPAYSCSELGTMILFREGSYEFDLGFSSYYRTCFKKKWRIKLYNGVPDTHESNAHGETEAIARAAAVIWSIEKNKLSIADCNKSLMNSDESQLDTQS